MEKPKRILILKETTASNLGLSGIINIECGDGISGKVQITKSVNRDVGLWLAVKCADDMKLFKVEKGKAEINGTGGLPIQCLLLAIDKNTKITLAAYASTSQAQPTEAIINEARQKLLTAIGLPYYKRINTQLLAILEKHPPYLPLIREIKNSYWVKVPRGEAFYSVGLVLNNSIPKYIGYALPEEFVNKPDDAFDFLEVSTANKTQGFFIIYQDAITGQTK